MNKVRELFDQDITRRIEKVIQYQTTEESLLRQEVEEYVVTDAIQQNIERLLDEIDDKLTQASSGEVGVWVSGFYGSGKSSFTKYFGYSLDPDFKLGGQPFRQLFKNRLTNQPLAQRLETVAHKHQPVVILLDLSVDAIAHQNTLPVSSVVFTRVLQWAGYSRDPKLAYLEMQAEQDGRLDELKAEAEQRGRVWHEIHNNPVIGGGIATQIAMKMYPEAFPDERSFQNLKIDQRISEQEQVEKMLALIEQRKGRQKVIFIIDEAGQYVASNDTLVLNLQGFAQNLKAVGRGRAWVIATAQQTLTDDVGAMNSPKLFKLKDRFQIDVKLKADDIKEITHRRLLSKKPAAKPQLEALYDAHGSRLNVLTRLENARGYATSVEKQDFVHLYPFLPQHFDLMMNIIARLARSTGGTGLRSAIKVVQETLVSAGSGTVFADRPLGTLVTVVSFFDVLREDIANAQALRHTVEAVQKTEARFGAHSLESSVAKAVAVMQVLDDFPLTRKNLAALLVDSVDAADQSTAIDAAIDALQQDRSIPLEEVDGRLRFLSDRAAEMQRSWHDYQPTSHEQRQIVADVINEAIVPAQPKATIHGNKQIRAGVALRFADYPTTLSSGADGITVDLRFVDPAQYDAERATALNGSTAPDAAKLIVVLSALDSAVATDIRDAYAGSRMIRELRARTRDADEDEFYRSLGDREKHSRARIADALKIATAQAALIYRGRDVAVHGAAASFGAALESALAELGKEVYDKYQHAAVTVDTGTAEKIVKARSHAAITSKDDPLDLLTGGSGGAFNEGHPAVIDIIDWVERHGTVDGKRLLEDFSRDPYGWNKDVTRYVVAAMFAGGRIALRINSQTVTSASPSVIDAFKSNVTFSKVGVNAPPSPPSADILKRAKDRLVELTGESLTPIARNIETTAREVLPELRETARSLAAAARTMQLTAAQRAADLVEEIDGLLASDQSNLIRALGDQQNDVATRLSSVRSLQSLMDGPFGRTVEKGRRLLETIRNLPQSGVFAELLLTSEDACMRLHEVFQDPGLEEHQVDVQELVHKIESLLQDTITQERSNIEADIAAYAEAVEQGAGWGELDEQNRQLVARKLDDIRALSQYGDSATEDAIEASVSHVLNARYTFSTLRDELDRFIAAKLQESRKKAQFKTVSVPARVLGAAEAREALRAIADELEQVSDETTVRFSLEE